MTATATRDCACKSCVNACRITPGWFAPGEAEKTAEHLGVPFEELKKRLIQDTCDNRQAEDAPRVWSPRRVNEHPMFEERNAALQRTPGKCTFLDSHDRCSIHEAKPYECRVILACDYKGHWVRDEIEQMYIKAGAPLGYRL